MRSTVELSVLGSVTEPADIVYPNTTVICPRERALLRENVTMSSNGSGVIRAASAFEQVWDLHRTVPVFLAFLMFPLLNFKNVTFFTKFNSLGE